MDMTTPRKSKPLVDVTCKLGAKGCFEDGRCHALGNCENKITTNADRIRAMTDEELACFICDRISNCAEQYCPGAGTCGIRIGKASGLVEWLKQPAEVDHG